jgi:hypothetical protein
VQRQVVTRVKREPFCGSRTNRNSLFFSQTRRNARCLRVVDRHSSSPRISKRPRHSRGARGSGVGHVPVERPGGGGAPPRRAPRERGGGGAFLGAWVRGRRARRASSAETARLPRHRPSRGGAPRASRARARVGADGDRRAEDRVASAAEARRSRCGVAPASRRARRRRRRHALLPDARDGSRRFAKRVAKRARNAS